MINFGIKSDRALDFLRGEVKTVTRKTYDINNGVKKLSDHSKTDYNSDGIRSLSLYYEENGDLRLRQVSEFDNDGNKIGYINYNANGLHDSDGKYVLNDEGKIVSMFHNGEIEEKYEYDNVGNNTEVLYTNTGSRELYKYDKNGLATQQLTLKGVNSLFGNLLGGPKRKLTTFVNDHWGNIIEMKVSYPETGKILFFEKNTINKQSDEIESIVYNPDETVFSYVKYEYDYDNNGNWIFKKTLTEERRVYREQVRVITYYSDNAETIHNKIEGLYKYEWRYKTLNKLELVYLANIVKSWSLPRPQRIQLLVEDGFKDGSNILYFEMSYFVKLTRAMAKVYDDYGSGKGGVKWYDFMCMIESAKPIKKIESKTLKPYFLPIE